MSEELGTSAVTAVSAPTRVPWGLGDVVGSLVIILGAEVVGGGILYAATAAAGAASIQRNMLAFNILGYQFLVLGVIVSAVWLIGVRYQTGPEALGYRVPSWSALAIAVLGGTAAVFLGSVLVTEFFHAFLPQYGLKGNAKEVLAGVHPHMAWILRIVTVLWAGVEAPLAEETLFRGIIFQGMRHFFGRWLPFGGAVFSGAVSSGFLFGLAHFEPRTLPVLFFVGVVLAYVFQYGRSVFASTLVHCILNTSVAIYILQSSG